MKKLITIIWTTVMLLSLVACGNSTTTSKDENPSSPQSEPAAQTTNSEAAEQPSEEPVPTETEVVSGEMPLADALAVYDLVEEDFKSEGFVEFDKYTIMGKVGEPQSMLNFCVKTEGEPTEKAVKEWYTALYDKLVSLSDTGKVYQDMQGGNPFSSAKEVIDSAPTIRSNVPAFTCFYPYQFGEKRGYIQVKISYIPNDQEYSVLIWMMNYIR